jgi:Fur family transcriptional regulator, ferric uptake regulator
MQRIHSQEKEQFKKLFSREHPENFEERFKVLEVFLSTEKHLTCDELCQILAARGEPLAPEFVRETLKLLSRFGLRARAASTTARSATSTTTWASTTTT